MGTHRCALAAGEHCSRGLVCLGCRSTQPKKSATPIFQRMLASHEAALERGRGARAGRAARRTRAVGPADRQRIAPRRRPRRRAAAIEARLTTSRSRSLPVSPRRLDECILEPAGGGVDRLGKLEHGVERAVLAPTGHIRH